MNHRDGWDYGRQIDVALTKLGFSAQRRAQPIDELSGGWRNRAALAQCLLQQPDVLLLDEPTNFLDVEGVAWLESWLSQFQGGAIVVSHDRRLLDRVVNRVVEVENYQLHDYAGNYSAYVRAKPSRIKMLERQFQHEEELLALEAEAIRDVEAVRRDPSPAQRRKLADIKRRREPRPVEQIVTSLYQGLHVPDRLCRVETLAKGYGEQQLFSELTFELNKGERLAIVGPNGSGKSTLLRILIGDETPDAGRVLWGGAQFADYSQMLSSLDPDDSVTHAVNIMGMARLAPRKQVNRFLTLLRFSEHDLQRRIRELSGGQRARVALAQCLLSGAPTLILDEPTRPPRRAQHPGDGAGAALVPRRRDRGQPRPLLYRQGRHAAAGLRRRGAGERGRGRVGGGVTNSHQSPTARSLVRCYTDSIEESFERGILCRLDGI